MPCLGLGLSGRGFCDGTDVGISATLYRTLVWLSLGDSIHIPNTTHGHLGKLQNFYQQKRRMQIMKSNINLTSVLVNTSNKHSTTIIIIIIQRLEIPLVLATSPGTPEVPFTELECMSACQASSNSYKFNEILSKCTTSESQNIMQRRINSLRQRHLFAMVCLGSN
jgi:hypothetical protein